MLLLLFWLSKISYFFVDVVVVSSVVSVNSAFVFQ